MAFIYSNPTSSPTANIHIPVATSTLTRQLLMSPNSFINKVALVFLTCFSVGLGGCSPIKSDEQNSNESQSGDEATVTTGAHLDKSDDPQSIRIAAAANLSDVLPKIINRYIAEKKLPKQSIEVTYASSGKLYAQIIAGAPYDLFLSANQEFATKLATRLATEPTNKRLKNTEIQQPFSYARGQLALYSVTTPIKPLSEMTLTEVLKSQPMAKVTIANPELAPYGASARAYLKSQGLYDSLVIDKRLIQAENIGQAFQYTNTGNVDYGFVAQSQVTAIKAAPTQFVTLPADSYPAILQDGLVIRRVPLAEDFANYLRSPAGQQQLIKAGYLAID